MTTIVEREREAGPRGSGGRLVSVDGQSLPLAGAVLESEAGGGLARTVLRQTFRNEHDAPLEVLYTFPLPADGAVAAYEFRIGDRRVTGRIEKRAAALEEYERALVQGRTAGLVDQERANLFTQRLGNVPPGVTVVVELRVDQKLRWLAEGLWEWRFPTVAAPRYLGEEGRVADATEVSVDVAEGGTGVRATLDLIVRDALPEGGAPQSPSHAIDTRNGDAWRVSLAGGSGAALDRDLVVRWPVAREGSGVTLLRARPPQAGAGAEHVFGLLTIVPPEGPATVLPRDLIVLIDTSGSMSGRPLELAKTAVRGLIDGLEPTDRLEMIAFSGEPRRWRRGAASATAEMRRAAVRWVEGLAAGGGTEMTRAVEEALRPLEGDALRQVVLVTDGQIGFEQEVFRAIRDRLPSGSRLHTVGVGSATNHALLGPAARAGRGVAIGFDLDDDAARGVARLVAATRRPVLVDVAVDGPAVTGSAPRHLPDLMAGAPLLASIRLRPEGGRLSVLGRAGEGGWERVVDVPPTAVGEGTAAIAALFGREAVADLELDRAVGHNADEVDLAIERLGLAFGLATRLTSFVAVSEEPAVDPLQPVKVTRIPQELPYGLSAEGLGLRSARGLVMGAMLRSSAMARPGAVLYDRMLVGRSPMRAAAGGLDWLKEKIGGHRRGTPIEPGDEAVEAQDAAQKDVPGHAVPVPPWRFAARWVPGTEPGTWVLRLMVEGEDGLDWQPAATAQLILRSGTRADVDVVPTRTTHPGHIEPGTAVVLGLRLGGHDPADVLAVEVESAGRLLRLDP